MSLYLVGRLHSSEEQVYEELRRRGCVCVCECVCDDDDGE